MDQENFDFSAEPKSFGPFKIGQDDYILKEPSEAAHTAYKSASMKSMRAVVDDKENRTVTMAGTNDADAVLVAHCLFKVTPGGEVPSKLSDVNALPRRITKQLYRKVRELGEMDEEEETEEFLKARIKRDTEKLAKKAKGDSPGKDDSSSTENT